MPLETGGAVKLMPISTDPPYQRELRRLIDKHYEPRKVAAAEDSIRAGAVALLERFQDRGRCEFVAEYAVQYPANTFFRYSFGVEPDATGRVMGWIDHMLHAPNEAADRSRRSSTGRTTCWPNGATPVRATTSSTRC